MDIIKDEDTKQVMDDVKDALITEPLINSGFVFKELVFTAALTNTKVAHGLGFRPLDIIQTSLTGAGAITWNYAKFTDVNLDITVTGACTVRAFIGAYR
jgi:hypothetical protein